MILLVDSFARQAQAVRKTLVARPDQAALFDVPTSLLHVAVGVVYLMTDWYVLKWGWTGRDTPEQRSGELRASVIGFMAGSRADEDAYKRQFARWCIGGEWFRVPDDPAELHNLWLITAGMGQWKGVPATESLTRVIANNLRRAA